MRVCVIGAGVAGLVSAKVLNSDGFDVTVFEKASAIGGVWAPCRAYADLRTNNPRETYAFSDFAYPAQSDEFPTAPQVQSYLESYADDFGIQQLIQLDTEVVSVGPRPSTRTAGVAPHPEAVRDLISPRLTVDSVKGSPWPVDTHLPDRLAGL